MLNHEHLVGEAGREDTRGSYVIARVKIDRQIWASFRRLAVIERETTQDLAGIALQAYIINMTKKEPHQ